MDKNAHKSLRRARRRIGIRKRISGTTQRPRLAIYKSLNHMYAQVIDDLAGKTLVAAMLEGGGFEVIDLGVNGSPEQFVAAVKEKNAQVVAMSALLTTTMPSMKVTIEALKNAGVRDQVKVLIGGAPITQRYADEIGADGFSENAPGAVTLARKALGK